MHKRTCFRWHQHKRVHTIAAKLKLFNFLVRFRLELQRAPGVFARDLKVCANLTLRSTVKGTEAFTLVYDVFTAMGKEFTSKSLQRLTQGCLIKLQNVFEEGKAWPTDLAMNGESLLHVGAFISILCQP